MLLRCGTLTNTPWIRTPSPVISILFRSFTTPTRCFTPLSPSNPPLCVDEECDDFLPWLERKAGTEISSVLAVGTSSFGRTLYASDCIRAGDCILKVPYSVQMAPDNLSPEISCLLGNEVGNVAKVALLILLEQKLGQNSEWAPYIRRLPKPEKMHSTVFWSNDELEMIRPSALYRETLKRKAQIGKDFTAIKAALDGFLDGFQHITLQEFTYAYGLVTSRAWESSRGVSMIPFADFLNHDGISQAYVLSDELKHHSEVLADRDYAPGDQVLVEFSLPHEDQFHAWKLGLLERYRVRDTKDINDFTSDGNLFRIKEVRAGSKKGKGIPQALRAFGRIVSSNSQQEINTMVKEAAQSDGRLARLPLKDQIREIEAHQFLLSKIDILIEQHKAHIKLLEPTPPYPQEKSVQRRKLAHDLLNGELRVLMSASAWLKNYCLTLSGE